jgi:predicted negative regulator of RcsB-dependent stress response
MATSAKHISRKQLRQPDRFMVLTQKALDFAREKRTLLIILGALTVAVLIIIAAVQVYKGNQNEQAAGYFEKALTLYRADKHDEAIAEFEKVQAYRWSRYAAIAHLYEANSRLATNNLERARTAAQRFVAATDQNSLYRQIGLVTLGHIEESRAQCQEAIQHYTAAERIPAALKEAALLGKARCLTAVGDNPSAIAAYQQYIKENPNTPTSTRLILKVAEIQAASGEPQAAVK